MRPSWKDGWSDEGDITSGSATAQTKGSKLAEVSAMGWTEALSSYRPFLSYNEAGLPSRRGPLGSVRALASILGLEELTEAENLLSGERREQDERVKGVKADLARHLELLDRSDDERASALKSALAGKTVATWTWLRRPSWGWARERGSRSCESSERHPLWKRRSRLTQQSASWRSFRSAAVRQDKIALSVAGEAEETLSLLRDALVFHEHRRERSLPRSAERRQA